jgi:hypothetical protein
MAAAHGGQALVSASTAALVDHDDLLRLGEHRFKDIDEPVAIFQLGDGAFPPLKTISNTNLPRPASSFVGRESELAAVLGRFEQGARLVTLTGPGGSGKTRLALEAAATLVPGHRDGVFWVGLASLRDPDLVLSSIGQVLGARDGLSAHIGDRELLLLLDNLEQVIGAAPELSALLGACPNLTLLVTSRELLRIGGEVEFQVRPLAEAEAVALFCVRAQTEPSGATRELCARLDHLPLAVELAAARTRVLSPAQILSRLSDRLDLPTAGRDADPRHQTLRATIEWSYDLLSTEEQRLFRALSVFVGGCALDAAEEVADADVDTLQSLVEKSLLRFTDERYWMLETIREYAGERLSASAGRRPPSHSDTGGSSSNRPRRTPPPVVMSSRQEPCGGSRPSATISVRQSRPRLRGVISTSLRTRSACCGPCCSRAATPTRGSGGRVSFSPNATTSRTATWGPPSRPAASSCVTWASSTRRRGSSSSSSSSVLRATTG